MNYDETKKMSFAFLSKIYIKIMMPKIIRTQKFMCHNIYVSLIIYIYIYICVCVCVLNNRVQFTEFRYNAIP